MSSIIEHRGVIKEIYPDKVIIQIEQTSVCAECHAKHACSASDKKNKLIEIATINGNLFKKDEEVNIQGKSSLGLLAVWYAFALPLLLMLIPLLIFEKLRQNEGIAGLIALSTLTVYYIILYACQNKLNRKFVFDIRK